MDVQVETSRFRAPGTQIPGSTLYLQPSPTVAVRVGPCFVNDAKLTVELSVRSYRQPSCDIDSFLPGWRESFPGQQDASNSIRLWMNWADSTIRFSWECGSSEFGTFSSCDQTLSTDCFIWVPGEAPTIFVDWSDADIPTSALIIRSTTLQVARSTRSAVATQRPVPNKESR